MPTPQERQRPRSTAYESSGTLSYQASSVLQLMQAERGRTTERRSGTRAATTFTKLPSARAGQNASTPRATSTSALSVAGRHRLSTVSDSQAGPCEPAVSSGSHTGRGGRSLAGSAEADGPEKGNAASP